MGSGLAFQSIWGLALPFAFGRMRFDRIHHRVEHVFQGRFKGASLKKKIIFLS